MNKQVPARTSLPDKPVESKQYDLFTEFFGDSKDLSNTVEFWDAIPKYSVTARRQASLRDEKGRLDTYKHTFQYRQETYRLELTPARVEVDGQTREFFPSADEELVEEVIRKIFTDRKYGSHKARTEESKVWFSLQMIRRELAWRGKTRSLKEIKQSIQILSNAQIQIYGQNEVLVGSRNYKILSELAEVSRRGYLIDPKTMFSARLPELISKSINKLSYRQFSYGTFMSLSSQLARWLHKTLSHRFVNASFTQHYTVLYSTIKRDSGLLEHARISSNVQMLERALDELRQEGVLMGWEKEERRGDRNRIDDILYTLMADMEFIRQVKAANARQRDSQEKLSGRRLP